MALKEKLSDRDLVLYEITRHPILLGEFYRNLDQPDENVFEYSDYQREYLGDFNNFVSLCCARAVGKTVTLTDFIVRLLVNNVYKNEYILYTVPNKVHLEPVFTNLVRVFRTNEFLRYFIEPKRGINSGNFSIKLLNSAQLLCRIAGQSGGGTNIVGLHTPIILLDEAGFYPWGTWQELQPVLNTWQEGFKMWVAGVPTGFRENNVLYYADEVSEIFSTHNTAAHDNPRYTEDDEVRNIERYGGPDSEDYMHFVLGKHGSPTFTVFDRRLMKFEPYTVHKIKFSRAEIRDYSEIVARLSLIPPLPKHDIAIMGVDLGYTDPTSIIILYEKNGIIKEHARINFTKIPYDMQEKIIDFLDTKFDYPEIIGIDVGNEQGLSHHLINDEKYLHKGYDTRMVPVKFGAWVVLGTDQDGNEIKTKIKPHSVSLLQQFSNTHRLVYSNNDFELITELERMTYRKNPYGEIIYTTNTVGGGKRGDDHNTSALLCAIYSYFLLSEGFLTSRKPVKLLKSKWVYS